MKNLKEMSYDELKHKRDLIVNAKAFSICDIDRRGFQQTIKGIEKEMYRREIGKSRVLAAITGVLVLFSICVSSCQTVKGVAGDAGWILTTASDNIVIQDK
jgi:predicted small secreted protein